MSIVTFPSKLSSASPRYVFDFRNVMLPADSIFTSSVTIAVLSGTDDGNMGDMLDQATLVASGSRLTIQMGGGTAGVIYQLTATAQMNDANGPVYQQRGKIAVLLSDPFISCGWTPLDIGDVTFYESSPVPLEDGLITGSGVISGNWSLSLPIGTYQLRISTISYSASSEGVTAEFTWSTGDGDTSIQSNEAPTNSEFLPSPFELNVVCDGGDSDGIFFEHTGILLGSATFQFLIEIYTCE